MLRPSGLGRFALAVLVLAAGTALIASRPAAVSAAVHHTMHAGSHQGTRAASTPPNDANIAAIVVAANTIDIHNAREAERISKNSKVMDFARRMVTDHSAVNKKATDLAKRLDLTPRENATSRSLETSATRTRTHLMTLSGPDFDKAYIGNEVSYHQAVLDMMDKTLIPDAQNGDLKKLLEETRPAIEEHLKMAREIQGELSGMTGR